MASTCAIINSRIYTVNRVTITVSRGPNLVKKIKGITFIYFFPKIIIISLSITKPTGTYSYNKTNEMH